jgi:glucose-6-phosphate-specific signal transduction histidine kinase
MSSRSLSRIRAHCRILRELLKTVVWHPNVSEIEFAMHADLNNLTLTVTDDCESLGYAGADAVEPSWLVEMRLRVFALGARRIELSGTPSTGTKMAVSIPLGVDRPATREADFDRKASG